MVKLAVLQTQDVFGRNPRQEEQNVAGRGVVGAVQKLGLWHVTVTLLRQGLT